MEIHHRDKLYNKFKLTMDNKFRPRKLLVERNKSKVSKCLWTITRIIHVPRAQNFRVELSTLIIILILEKTFSSQGDTFGHFPKFLRKKVQFVVDNSNSMIEHAANVARIYDQPGGGQQVQANRNNQAAGGQASVVSSQHHYPSPFSQVNKQCFLSF